MGRGTPIVVRRAAIAFPYLRGIKTRQLASLSSVQSTRHSLRTSGVLRHKRYTATISASFTTA
jgi:hypothetical protein